MSKFARIFAVHDYLLGAWLLVMPWLLDFDQFLMPTVFSVLMGFGIITYSLFTDFEYGWVKFIPDPVHLLIDVAWGILLCVAPWLFNYAAITFWPHLLTGVFWLTATYVELKQKQRKDFKRMTN